MPDKNRTSGRKSQSQSDKREKSALASRLVSSKQSKSDGNRLPDASKLPRNIEAGLYLVATPIGNASDITLRALDTLKAADIIACEDTRVTKKLLQIHSIKPDKLISYHEHNAEKITPRIIEHLKSGVIVALVSDAGTPMINDPGYRIAEACRNESIDVHALPGPSAVTNALVLAGLPTDRFMYCGFPPARQGKRRAWLGSVLAVDATLVFLESAQRLASSLVDMNVVLGPRPACVLREMTKKFEEVRHGSLDELAAHYLEAGPPKGEVTLVIGAPEEAQEINTDDIDTRLRTALAKESVREAASRLAVETGLSRRDIYNRALAIKAEDY